MLIVNEALEFYLLQPKTYWHRYCERNWFTVKTATRNVFLHFPLYSAMSSGPLFQMGNFEYSQCFFVFVHASIHPCKYCVFCLRTRDMTHSSESMCGIFFVPFMSTRLNINTLQLNSSILNRLIQHLFGYAPRYRSSFVSSV